MINNQILVTSINKEIEKSKVYGKLDLTIPYLFETVLYYIKYTSQSDILNEENKKLKQLAYDLKYKYSDILCNYKIIDSSIFYQENTPPTVDDNSLDLEGKYFYKFKKEDFLLNYNDLQNHTYNQLMVFPNNLEGGDLYLNGNKLTTVTVIDLRQDFELIYRVNYIEGFSVKKRKGFLDYYKGNEEFKEEINDSFLFKVSDIEDAFSITHTYNITNSLYKPNQPANISDVFITADNRVVTTLTLNMFTNMMIPPYSDPENDLIDAIRIDFISSSNQGTFKFNNIPIQEGDIITREDLNNNLFKHEGPDVDTLATDSIEFSARDEGSLIWVQ